MNISRLSTYARRLGLVVIECDDEHLYVAQGLKDSGGTYGGSPIKTVQGAWLRVQRTEDSTWQVKVQNGGQLIHQHRVEDEASLREVLRSIRPKQTAKESTGMLVQDSSGASKAPEPANA